VFDPEAAANTTAAGLHHKHKSTPYLGMPLVGRVLATFVRGQQVSCSRLLCGSLLAQTGSTFLKGGTKSTQALAAQWPMCYV
jgi:hypothetical protein